MPIIAGSTPKFLVKIKDENGLVMDPEDGAAVIDVLIWIYNAISGTIIAKFYLNALPAADDGWRQITRVTADDSLVLTLTAEETLNAPGNQNEIKIAVTVPDTDFADSQRTEVNIGNFPEIKHTKEEE